MTAPDADEDATQLLAQARQRAGMLLEELQRHRADLQRSGASSLNVPDLASGREALDRAIASVQRLLKELDASPDGAGAVGE